MKVLSGQKLWDTLSALSQTSKRCHCAVAYVSTAGILKLSRDDLLVVDASDESIMGGRTSAHELRELRQLGVQIYSCGDLHTKIYVFDDCVVVGSCNLSINATNYLIEAAAVSADANAIQDARSLIQEIKMKSEYIDDAFIDRIMLIPVRQRNAEYATSAIPCNLWRLRYPPNAISVEMKCYFHALIVAQIGGLFADIPFLLWSGPNHTEAFREHLSQRPNKPKRLDKINGQYFLTKFGVDYFSKRKLDEAMIGAFLEAIRTGRTESLPETVYKRDLIRLI